MRANAIRLAAKYIALAVANAGGILGGGMLGAGDTGPGLLALGECGIAAGLYLREACK